MENFPYKKLLDWYKKNGRHYLPWRQYENFSKKQIGYAVWLAEIMLQQTQVDRVISYWEKIINNFPTIEDLSKNSWEDFFPYYKWLGYYLRGKNMLKTAKIISKDYGGIFPDDPEILKNFPGIWSYTARAICAFSYEKKYLAWDTNLEKIFRRYYMGSKKIPLPKEIKQAIEKNFEGEKISSRAVHNAFMDYGSLISKNSLLRIPWEKYIFSQCCFFKNKWKLEQDFQKKNTQKISKNEVKICIILHENHKNYFSFSPDRYEPFFLEKNSEDHRHAIQDFFYKKYGLHISVRPAFLKTQKIFFYQAQIQSGNENFGIFSKKDFQNYWEENRFD